MAILVTYLNFNRASISSTHSIQDPEQKNNVSFNLKTRDWTSALLPLVSNDSIFFSNESFFLEKIEIHYVEIS